MEYTTAEIYNTKEPLAILKKERLPISVGLKVIHLTDKLETVIKTVDLAREHLIMTYGEPDPNRPTQRRIAPGDEHFPQFAIEYGTLLTEKVNLEFEVVALPAMVASVCPHCHQTTERELSIEPYVLAALDKFVEVAEPMVLKQNIK